MKLGALAGVVEMALTDGLGPYGGQRELRTQPRNRATTEGPPRRMLQVAGEIDLELFGATVARQITDVLKREHPEIVEPESFDDL